MKGQRESEKFYMQASPAVRKNINAVAEMIAKERVRPGDYITRTLCGGRHGTFRFCGWEGGWMIGVTVNDCAPVCVTAINGLPVDFCADAIRVLNGEVAA